MTPTAPAPSSSRAEPIPSWAPLAPPTGHLPRFPHLDGETHAQQGTWTSPLYDAGSIVSWDAIRWTENLPSGCDVVLEVAVADELSEFENRLSPPAYFGPSGPSSVFTTPGGQALPSNTTGRYARIRATLTGNGTATPSLSDIQLSCNSGSDIPSQVRRYRYDEAGNLLQVTTTTDSGTSTDLRDDPSWSSGQRLNALNQIKRQDVGGHTWLYTYSDSGALLSKTNGTDTWTYTWDPVEDRLLRVQGPGGVDVNLTYDMAGRMLTRTSGGVTTTFLWDGWDCIRESTPTSTTHYLIPEGQLLGFRRDGEHYSVASDALGCVRLVTDSSGTVVFRRDYGAWGEALPGGFDSVPGGMPYSFVGALGVRTDADTGLMYMRQRWYDSTLQRFISRDPIGLEGGANLYSYVRNSPTTYIDLTGREPVPAPPSAPPGAGPIGPAPPQTTTVINAAEKVTTGQLVVRAGLYGLGGYLVHQILQGYLDMEEGKRQARDAQIAEEVTRLRQQAKERRRKREIPEPPNCPPIDCDEVYEECRTKCVKIFTDTPRKLPGSGRDFGVRLQRCIRQCLDENGC